MPSLDFILNMSAAVLMGMVIGLERQWRQHTAGLRTTTLVSLGAAMFVSLSLLMNEANSPTRMASYVVSGLGFLGGGVILRDGLNVKGLNTAASLWCSGAVGTLCGSGFAGHALLGTVAVLFINYGLRPVALWIDARVKMSTDLETCYQLRIEAEACHDAQVRQLLMRQVAEHAKLNLHGISTKETESNHVVVMAEVFSAVRNDRGMEEIVARVSIEPEVKAVSWKRMTG